MAALACGGTLDGVRLLSATTLAQAIAEQCYGKDRVLGFPIRWGGGFMLTSRELLLGPNPRTFGHGGWGGSLGFADLLCGRELGVRDEQDVSRNHRRHPRRRAARGALRRARLTSDERTERARVGCRALAPWRHLGNT